MSLIDYLIENFCLMMRLDFSEIFDMSQERKNIEKKIDQEITESVKNALEAPDPKSEELTKYIWAED